MIICLLIPVSAVSASDINNTAADNQVLSATPNVDTISANVNNGENNNDTLSVQNDENVLSAGINDDSGSNESILKLGNDNLLKDTGTGALDFNSLNSVIRLSTDGYALLTDYYYNNQPIEIFKSNFVLDGNHHTLDGKGNTVFKITGDNVTIKNLNIINTKVNNWDGDNGNFFNVNISESLIGSGCGIIDWEGNNGTLKDFSFINVRHTAGGVSDASCIYFGGINYLLDNFTIANPNSQTGGLKDNVRGKLFFDVTAVGNNTVKNGKFKDIIMNNNDGMGLIFARGIPITVINMTTSNVKGDSDRSYLSTVIATGYMEMYNSTIDASANTRTNPYILYGGNAFYNCKFTGNQYLTPYDPMSSTTSVIFDNCSFSNFNKGLNLPAYAFISDTSFNNFNLGNYPLFKHGDGFYQLDNCTFYNNTVVGSLIYVNSGNSYVFNKLTFKDNTVGLYLLNINETIQANVYENTFKYSGNTVGAGNVNFTGQGFTPSSGTIYVSDTPVAGGDGSSRDKSISLNDALANVPYGGKIIIINGTHTLDKATTFGCDVIGEKNVIINMTNNVLTLSDSIKLSDLTILNMTYISVGSNNKISNINISKNVSNVVFQFNGKLDVELNNILIFNSTLGNNYLFTFTNSRSIPIAPRLTINGLKVDHVTSTQYLIGNGGFLNSKLNNIEVTNSTIKGVYTKTTNSMHNHNINSVDSSFNTVTIKNSNITSLIINSENVVDSDLKYNNIIIDNINATTDGALFYFRYNQVVNGLSINNLNASNLLYIINLGRGGDVINDVEINGFNNNKTSLIFNSALYPSTVNNLVVNKVNLNQLQLNSSDPNYPNYYVNFNGLHVFDSKFNQTIISLVDNCYMQDSEFRNYTGHIVIIGDNVKISGTTFTDGNNTDLNGSSIYVNTSSDLFRLDNCIFTGNNASNGTVYVSDNCQRPQISKCTFNDNIAKYQGGAIYIVSAPGNEVTVGIDSSTNSTIYYIGQERYKREGYNDFYGYLKETYDILFLTNDTQGKTGSDANGKTRETPSSDLTLLYNLLDGAKVYFVNYGESFTPRIAHFNYPSTFSNVTFYGNGTILLDMGFTVTSSSPNLKVYNITFKNYPDTALIVNASGCLFDNCSFVNVGGNSVLYGGAMQINSNDTTIRNSSFIGNGATHMNTQGISDAYGGALYINASHVTVENCHFEENSVSNDGAHIFIASGQDDVVLTGNNFTKSSVVGEGSGSSVVVQGTNMKIQDNNFTNNSAKQGAALSVIGDNSFLNLVNNNFTNNTALDNGGALYLAFTNSMSTPNTIKNNNFTNNSAVNGGALYVDSSSLIGFTMTGNNYTNNSATDGGAVYINCPDFELVGATVENNTATNGGGVYVNAAGVTIRDVDFIGNNATVGGALYVNALGTNVVGSNFIANNATTVDSYGSAVFVSENGGITLTDVELNKNYVYGENSTFQRGDIYVNGGRFADNGITYGDEPYKQYLSNESVYRLTIAYVSEIGGGSGTAYNDPTTLSKVLKVLDSNAIVYIVGNDDLTYNMLTLANLTNVTIVNFNDGRNRKIKPSEDAKYLFIHPNT